MKLRWQMLLIFAVSAALLAAPAPSSAAAATKAPRHGFGRGTSTNWSGYAIDGTGATSVVGTWTEPSVKCAAGESSWSSPWVGIDGDTDSTVEQTGTDSDCQNGTPTYYAWYEMYPKSTVVVKLTVRPGDSITGQVTYAAGSFALKLTDNTTGASFTTAQQSKKARRSSVEWIMEGPSSGLLSDFGSVSFTGASATIDGQSGALGSFAGTDPISMVSKSGTVRAAPSSLSGGGTAFGVTWEHS